MRATLAALSGGILFGAGLALSDMISSYYVNFAATGAQRLTIQML